MTMKQMVIRGKICGTYLKKGTIKAHDLGRNETIINIHWV
jgi:hypothetical protein